MARFMQGRKKRLVVDIGTSAIRICELAQTKTGYQLVKYYQKEFNADPTLDEETKKSLKKKALDDLLKQAKIRTRKTMFGVPGQSVFTRTRALPPVPEYKVTQIVKYEIQQQIPFGLDQIAMDYQVLSRTDQGGFEVMMAAIKVDVVDKHIDILQELKRTIDVVDVSPISAYNWLKYTGEFGDQGECIALVDIGASTTDIVIERGNQFRFTRPLNIGGNDITQSIANAFNLPFLDAERVKRERGFAPTGDPNRDGKGGEAIGKVLQRFVTEIMRSFSYFRSLPGGSQVNRVILCGGGACLRNIVPFLQRQLGMEVRIAQPLAGLAIAPSAQQASEHPEQSAVVLGLALRCCQSVPIEINLIPPRVVEAARQKEQAFYWALSLATLALIMASIIPISANDNKIVLQRIEMLKTALSSYDPEMVLKWTPGAPPPESNYKRAFEEAQSAVKALEGDVLALDGLRENRQFWLDAIALVADTRPPTGGIWFSSIESAMVAEPADGGGRNQPRGGRGGGQRGGGLAQLAAGGGIVGGGTGGPIDKGGVGFPGIEISTPLLAAGTRGGRPGGGQRGRAQQQEGPQVPAVNGVIVQGFARSDVLVKQFVDELKRARRTMPNSTVLSVTDVRFSEATVQRVPIDTLCNVPMDLTSLATTRATDYAQGQEFVYTFVIGVQLATGFNVPPPGGAAAPATEAPVSNASGGGPPTALTASPAGSNA